MPRFYNVKDLTQMMLLNSASAEISVTIIAASTPPLRIQLREMKSSAARRYYVQTGGSKNPFEGQEVSHGTVKSHSAEKDDEGDREILGSGAASGKIYRVDKVDVEFSTRRDLQVSLRDGGKDIIISDAT